MDSWLKNRPETIYSHQKRLAWMEQRLSTSGQIVELGCGTGVMLSIPLRQAGFNIVGFDRDEDSVRCGREIAARLGVDPDILRCAGLDSLNERPDAIIVSEVLEHLPDAELEELLEQLSLWLDGEGRLLVTVPNGYGWYEFEAWLWKRLGIGRLLSGSFVERAIMDVKTWLSGYKADQIVEPYPSSLDQSPHVQRFTLSRLIERVSSHGFEQRDVTGSGLFAGQLSNLLFSGFNILTRLNNWLGDRMPRVASGFYVEFVRR